MKKFALILCVLIFQTQVVFAQDLKAFLKSCAWGTLAGAGAGVVSLAFTDKPSESWNNVAKGASLGLYAGIAYGLYQANKEPEKYQQPDFALFPSFSEGKVDGVQITSTVFSF
ncbi:hypothetical protein [Bdellovibrio bacteriovorus]|uniref:hypothetical protein n=1 Tax=Bdellovibrio TaxID=958 RepID=UPI0035A92C6E